MKIHYQNRKLEKILTSEKEIKRKFGNLARSIMRRLYELEVAYENLGEIPHNPPQRFHDLTNYFYSKQKSGIQFFSIDVSPNYRIVFHAIPEDIPKNEHGKWVLEEIEEILIVGIEDTHE